MQLMTWVSADPDRRTKATHPYNYDPFTMWRGPGEPDGSVYTDRLLRCLGLRRVYVRETASPQ